MARRFLLLCALSAAALPLGATLVSADDGPPRLLSAAGRLRPPETIERSVNFGPPSALFTVRGYGSTPDQGEYWDPLLVLFPERRHYDFGSDAGHYDTRGPVAASGDAMRREIQRLVREEDLASVTIVSVSLGGVVTDEAFRSGLSARDNVDGWVAIASPLNGSTTARVVRGADLAATALGAQRELAELVAPLGAGIHDPAMIDLAKYRSFEAPRDVPTTQFWAVADELVLDRDTRVDGARYVRTLTPTVLSGAAGHGGQLADARTRAMVAQAVRGEAVRQHPIEAVLARLFAPPTDAIRHLALMTLGVGFVWAAVTLSLARRVLERVRWPLG